MADNKPAVLGGTAIKPKERHGWEAVRYILHNPETGEYLTRTPKSWALIFIFYVIYYSCLAAFWAAMLMIFFTTLPEGQPKWIGAESLIGTTPGVGLKPEQTDARIDSSMIQFNYEKEEDGDVIAGWGGWAQRSTEFLSKYDDDRQTGHKACSAGDGATDTQACKFDKPLLGPCASGNHGYDEGKPCIFLKLNRIFGVTNTPLDPANLPEDLPENLKSHIQNAENLDQVWVDCHGEYPGDIEALGEIEYFPYTRGFPNYFFPFKKQDGYVGPLVAVRFPDLKKDGRLLHVECRAWAQNIGYDKRDRIGISHFELQVFSDALAKEVKS